MINIEILNNQNSEEVTGDIENTVEKAIEIAAGEFEIPCGLEVSVTFTDNASIRETNNLFRNVDAETDVLSFPQLEYDIPGVIKEEYIPKGCEYPNIVLGDIVISLQKARTQAEEYNHSYFREIGYLTVHSMLHLFGYDHIEEKDKIIMREKEEIIMNKLGLTR